AISPKRIKLGVVTQLEAAVEFGELELYPGISLNEVQMRIPGNVLLVRVGVREVRLGQARIDTAAVAGTVVAHLGGEVQIAAIERLETDVARDVVGDPAGVVVPAVRRIQ